MANLRDRKVKSSSGGYERIFGNVELGNLISKIQSMTIVNGVDLEKLISERVPNISELDKFLEREIMPDGVFLVRKKQIKRSSKFDTSGAEPDFLIFKRRNNKQRCHVIELKDGHLFDTKKSEAERTHLHRFTEKNSQNIPYCVSIHIVSFNKDTRKEIVAGFKRKITEEEAMTGPEFCDLVEIDYQEMIETRKRNQEDNFRYFTEEVCRILSLKKVDE